MAYRHLMSRNCGRVIARKDFGTIFSAAYAHNAKPINAVAGFRAAGIFPFDIRAIKKTAFAQAAAMLADGECVQNETGKFSRVCVETMYSSLSCLIVAPCQTNHGV